MRLIVMTAEDEIKKSIKESKGKPPTRHYAAILVAVAVLLAFFIFFFSASLEKQQPLLEDGFGIINRDSGTTSVPTDIQSTESGLGSGVTDVSNDLDALADIIG